MEVCVDCIASAKNAELGGASRVELCSALSEGGLTPSVGLLQLVKSLVSIPVFVMIRPRRGLDFVYTDDEVEVMEIDLKSLKTAGADGFVFGVLTSSRQVNRTVCGRLLQIASPLPCTFHRAFDVLQEPLTELEIIISLGFQRVLTSGCEESAFKGVQRLKLLVEISQNRIIIMPGAGLSKDNLEFILRETGAKEFHASARTPISIVESNGNANVSMGTADFDSKLLVTNEQLVKDMVEISKRV